MRRHAGPLRLARPPALPGQTRRHAGDATDAGHGGRGAIRSLHVSWRSRAVAVCRLLEFQPRNAWHEARLLLKQLTAAHLVDLPLPLAEITDDPVELCLCQQGL